MSKTNPALLKKILSTIKPKLSNPFDSSVNVKSRGEWGTVGSGAQQDKALLKISSKHKNKIFCV